VSVQAENVGRREPLIDADEAAELLGVSRWWVYEAVKAGSIPFYRLGTGPRGVLRFRRSELEAWLAARRR